MWQHCCLCIKSGPRLKSETTTKSHHYRHKQSDSVNSVEQVEGDEDKPNDHYYRVKGDSIFLTITDNDNNEEEYHTELVQNLIERTAELAEPEANITGGESEKSAKNSLFSIDEGALEPQRSSYSSAKSFNFSQIFSTRHQGSFSNAESKKNSTSLSKKNSLNLHHSRKSETGITPADAKRKLIKKSSFNQKTKEPDDEDFEEKKDVVTQLPKTSTGFNSNSNRLHNIFMNKLGLSTSVPSEASVDSNFSQDLNLPVYNSRRGSLYIFRNTDEPIVTPFAQILASLRKVRTNFMSITHVNKETTQSNLGSSKLQLHREDSNQGQGLPNAENQGSLANETLRELEWCLERLENIQTHRSVSDMASSKFKKLLNKELSLFASDGTKSGTQISEYICSTFLDSANEPEVHYNTNELLNQENIGSLLKKDKTRKGIKNENTPDQTSNSAKNSIRLDILARNCDLHVGVKAEFVAKVQGVGISNEKLPKYGVSKTEEIEKFFETNPLDQWGIDIFELAKTTEYPLTCLSYSILQKREIFEKFNIPPWNAVRYFMLVEYHYNSKVPYHNSIHAADVVQSTNVLLEAPALNSIFSDLELFAVIFACAVHDVDHPGVTNQYLINTNDSLAVLYNDSSVLENHHLAVAFTLLNQNGCDLTGNLTKSQRTSFRRMIIDMVLATDMSKHMDLLADLKTMVETKKVSEISVLNLDKYPNRIQILQNMVHCADLSNPTKPLELYQQWNTRIMQEFFFQGDLERAAGLDISPMCDRETASLEKTQVSFINLIVHPLWETWSELVHPYGQDILELLESNREWYFSRITNVDQKKETTETCEQPQADSILDSPPE